MKRIDKGVSVELPPIRLHIDELKYILDTASKDSSVELRSGHFVYESVTDLQQNVSVESLRTLSVRVWNHETSWSDLRIDIEPHRVTVTGDGAMKDRAATWALRLAEKSPWYSWYPTKHSSWWDSAIVMLMLAALGLSFWYCFYLTPDWGPVLSNSVFALAAIPFLMAFFSERAIVLGTSRLYLCARDSRRSFWQRNKDDILRDVLKLLLGTALGFLLARLTGSVHP